MAPRHRVPDEHPLIRAGVARYLAWLQYALAVTNTVAAVALILDAPGRSPAMQFLQAAAPLPVWSILPATVTVLLLLGTLGYRTLPTAHALGMFLWLAITVGAGSGLVSATTTSPSASLLLTALLVGVTGWHTGALLFRRRVARLR